MCSSIDLKFKNKSFIISIFAYNISLFIVNDEF